MGRDWKKKVDSVGSQAKQSSSRQSQPLILPLFKGQKRGTLKAEATLFCVYFKCWTNDFPADVGWMGKSNTPNIHTTVSKNSSLCLYSNKRWWRLEAQQPLQVAHLFLQNQHLSCSFAASLLARTGLHLVQYNKEDSETGITGGWTTLCKGIVSLLWSSPTPSATDHSSDFIYLFCLLFTELFTEQLY